MKTDKKFENTRYFRYMIDDYQHKKLNGPTSFAEIFANLINFQLDLPDIYSVSWEGDNKGWLLQLGDYQEFLLNDYECKRCNDLCNSDTERLINQKLPQYMKKAFGIKYSISRKKYLDSKEKTL